MGFGAVSSRSRGIGLLLALGSLLLAGCSDGGRDPTPRDLSLRFATEVQDTVTFDFDSAELDAAARHVLDAQARFIRQTPEVWFQVEGHADRTGQQAYNLDLGRKRATAALDYLVSRGVNPAQLYALVSFGEERPAIDTQERERRNRRVIVSVGGYLDAACKCRKRPQ